jgi:opacity protein-like surface antigen
MRKFIIAVGLAVGVISVPSTSSAQAIFTPFAGATFEGDAPATQLSTGLAATFMGPVAGVEVELGYTPDFFATDDDVVLVGDNNVTSLMGNLILGVGAGPVRPYVTGGVGLLRSSISSADDLFDDVNENDFGVNVGAGAFVFFNDHVGVRGDLRYFRSFQDIDAEDLDLDLGTFDFWRAYAGLSLKF